MYNNVFSKTNRGKSSQLGTGNIIEQYEIHTITMCKSNVQLIQDNFKRLEYNAFLPEGQWPVKLAAT